MWLTCLVWLAGEWLRSLEVRHYQTHHSRRHSPPTEALPTQYTHNTALHCTDWLLCSREVQMYTTTSVVCVAHLHYLIRTWPLVRSKPLQCDARPMVTFPVAAHLCPMIGTMWHVCECFDQGRYLPVKWPSIKPVTSQAMTYPLNHTAHTPGRAQSIVMSMSVCLSGHITQKPQGRSSCCITSPTGGFSCKCDGGVTFIFRLVLILFRQNNQLID